MRRKSTFFFMDCSEAAECCNKAQYKEANLFNKAKLLLHLVYCKTCQRFTKRNNKLTELVNQSKIETCPEEQKQQWREQIKKEFAEGKS